MKLYDKIWKKRNIQLVKYIKDIELNEYLELCETADHTSKIMVDVETGNLLTGFIMKAENDHSYFITC